jgi:hypothetical protein
MIAKAALELINLDPRLARLRVAEIAKHLRSTDDFIVRSLNRMEGKVGL